MADLAARFAAQHIDGATLWSLSEGDLRELGLSFGQRKRLLDRLRPHKAEPPQAPAQSDDMLSAALDIDAAERALQQSALAEAARHLGEAERALDRCGEQADADRLRLRLLIARSAASRAQLGIASEEAGRLGRQVLELSRRLRETKSELMALTGLYTHAVVRAEYFVAGKWAEHLCERAEQAQDPTFRMIGRRGIGVVALHVGSLSQAGAALQEALDLYDEERHLHLAHAHGYDHAEICAGFLSFARWLAGDPVAGRAASDFAVSHSRRIAHMHSLAQALVFRAMLMSLAHDWDACRAAAEEAEAVGRLYDLAVMRNAGQFFSVAARLCASPLPPDAGDLKALRQAFAEFKRINPCNYQQICGLLLVQLNLRGGAVDEAETALLQAEELQARARESFLQPELLRMRALLLMARGDAAAARTCRETALLEATRLGAHMLALRVACDRAEQERTAANMARLTDVCGKLTSADGGADVKRCGLLFDASS